MIRFLRRATAPALILVSVLSLGCAHAEVRRLGFTNPTVVLADSVFVEVSLHPLSTVTSDAHPEPIHVLGSPYDFAIEISPRFAVREIVIVRATAVYSTDSSAVVVADRRARSSSVVRGGFILVEQRIAMPWRRFDLRVNAILTLEGGEVRRLDFEVPVDTHFTRERYNSFWAGVRGI